MPRAKPKSPSERAQILERIADRVDSQRTLRRAQALIDTWWPTPEVWNQARTKEDEKLRRKLGFSVMDWQHLRGKRSNEDKAAIIRREIVRVAGTRLREGISGRILAQQIRLKLELPPGITRPSESAVRRHIGVLRR